MKIINLLAIFSFTIWVASAGALSEEKEKVINGESLDGFQSTNLMFRFIKSADLPHYTSMFEEMDLEEMMGRPGFTPENSTSVFRNVAEHIENLPDLARIAPDQVLFALSFSLLVDTPNLSKGDFVGSMSIQKRLEEETAEFKNLAKTFDLFNLGIATRQASHGFGFGKEACNAVSSQFFKSANFPVALVWSTMRKNVPSIKVAEGCGFKKFSETKNADGKTELDHVHYVREGVDRRDDR